MTAGDTRPTLNTTISTDVDVGDGEIGVALDIVLLDPGGYVGRYLLWDKPVPSVDEIEILAAPMSIALQSELGDDRVLGMEIWHLRSSAKWFVPTSDAVARLADVGAIVSQYLS